MLRWFLVAMIVSVVVAFGYFGFRSDLCAWVNESPNSDGCGELFYWWVLPAISLIAGALVLIVGSAVTMSRPRRIVASFLGFAAFEFIAFTFLVILLPHGMGGPAR